MTTTSYWLEEPAVELPRAAEGGRRPEVLVLGGGVTGCSCALRLAERGVRVRLHEARRIAGGASGRNGGFALRGAAVPYDVAVERLGPERARRLMLLTERGVDRLAELAGDAFRRTGSLRLAADGAEREALRREHDALAGDGFAVEWVDELRPPLDGLYLGALLHPNDGAIHPARWVRRLARRAVEAGASIAEESKLSVDEAERRADAVVVATDGFTSGVLPEQAELVRPTRGQVLATEPLQELRYARPHYAREGYDYWHQLPDGRLLLGGRRDASPATEWTALEETTPLIQARLEELARELVGSEPRITHRWAGIWGTTPDGLPLAGRLPARGHTWIAAGYSGHGNILGLVCGALVADAIVGDLAGELELFDPSRFL
ncbi:MAG TPA: FAD-dependent oxidoreductase [Gaiellaceae bacterium]|nr:FAD-dependent oxidoreductase [Gaiellaceae bacterium]